MSERDQWLNRCKFVRRDFAGMDTTTRQPKFAIVTVLDDEPCDLFNKTERVATQGPSGTVFTRVQQPYLKIFPTNYQDLPDDNDEVLVDGARYRVLSREDFTDGGSGSYRGSRLRIQRTNVDTGPTLGTAFPADGSSSAEATSLEVS